MQVGVHVEGDRIQSGLLRSPVHEWVPGKPKLPKQVGVVALAHDACLVCQG